MKKNYRDAFVELTAEEAEKFGGDENFFSEVIHAAEDVADRTERTVIISGPDGIFLGLFNEHRGFWKVEENLD